MLRIGFELLERQWRFDWPNNQGAYALKAILILCVLQLILLALPTQKLVHIEGQLIDFNIDNVRTATGAFSQETNEIPAEPAGQPVFDEKRLRPLIRSELDVFVDSLLEGTEDPEPEKFIDPAEIKPIKPRQPYLISCLNKAKTAIFNLLPTNTRELFP